MMKKAILVPIWLIFATLQVVNAGITTKHLPEYKTSSKIVIDGILLEEVVGKWYFGDGANYENDDRSHANINNVVVPKVKTQWETIYDIEYKTVTLPDCR